MILVSSSFCQSRMLNDIIECMQVKYLRENRQLVLIVALCLLAFGGACVQAFKSSDESMAAQASRQTSKMTVKVDELDTSNIDTQSQQESSQQPSSDSTSNDSSNSNKVSISSDQSTSNVQTSSSTIIEVQTGAISTTDSNSGTSGYMFTKGGIGVENDKLHVSSTMNQPGTGTCQYTFSQDGAVRVKSEIHINNTKTCELFIPTTEFSIDNTYQYTVDFIGDDGTASAHQVTSDITFK